MDADEDRYIHKAGDMNMVSVWASQTDVIDNIAPINFHKPKPMRMKKKRSLQAMLPACSLTRCGSCLVWASTSVVGSAIPTQTATGIPDAMSPAIEFLSWVIVILGSWSSVEEVKKETADDMVISASLLLGPSGRFSSPTGTLNCIFCPGCAFLGHMTRTRIPPARRANG
ncbi:hypothetical protein ACHAW5_010281 [Stephanodiscus triporus]|uniref:Uncharacterized protein n=1 Tax=Stephanodiscus triporus TaxID=2934178 RepID=A0ABD3NYE7_9STRA